MCHKLLHTRFINEAWTFNIVAESREGRGGRQYTCADFKDDNGFRVRVSLDDDELKSQVFYVKQNDFHSLVEMNKIHGCLSKALSFYRLMEIIVHKETK